jgi:hypothetical protein
MSLQERLRTLAEALPEGASITLSSEAVGNHTRSGPDGGRKNPKTSKPILAPSSVVMTP